MEALYVKEDKYRARIQILEYFSCESGRILIGSEVRVLLYEVSVGERSVRSLLANAGSSWHTSGLIIYTFYVMYSSLLLKFTSESTL
jgi:hypothetical protein